ncbi:MAG: FlgD immunoglobulin-like domain containing protein [Candidatus Coatesbacteria bacterium]
MAVTALAAARLPAAPVQLEVEGVYQDTFKDATGLVFKKNVNVGPFLTPGVRVALGTWSWAQSYTPASETLWTPFDDPGATHNLTQVIKDSPTAQIQAVGLWQTDWRVSETLNLAPGITATIYLPMTPNPSATLAVISNLSEMTGLPGRYAFRGPYDMSLVPTRDYTATFKSFFCDNPGCSSALMNTAGAEVGFYEVAYGNLLAAALPFHTGAYTGSPMGEFFNEGVESPITLEWQVPYPLPPGSGWEYRLRITMTWSGIPASPICAPACSATIWADTVTIMAKGRKIPATGFITNGSCAPGLRPCGTQCIPPEAPCGWDAATLYVDAGSYLSPVFDSLSDQTVWKTIWWNVEQWYSAGGSNGFPRTPVAIKWRVGNSLDPGTWLAKREWFMWTIPNSVTCSGEGLDNCSTNKDCSGNTRNAVFPCFPSVGVAGAVPDPYRVPMRNEDTAQLYRDGASTYAVGRYFQYEVDFTGQFANDKYPPEADTSTTGVRELHDALRPLLRAVRVTYQPARGQVVTKAIRPSQLLKWKTVSYTVDTASGGQVNVDVLDEHEVPLFTGVPSGFSLAGLDPTQYPALKLRATVDNAGVYAQRPSLLSWEIRWDTFTDPLLVSCNAIDTTRDESCRITVVISATRPGTLSVHDGAGQLVKTLFRGVFPAGVQTFSWDGRNGNGDRVTTGVYFVSLRAKDIRRMKKLAVSR